MQAHHTRSIDGRAAGLALVLLFTCAAATASALPLLVALLVDTASFDPSRAGQVSSFYSAAGVLAGLAGLFWVRRADRRAVLLAAFAVGFSADLLSVWLDSFPMIAAGRFLTGLAGSTALIVVSATIATSHQSERLFGLCAASQAATSAGLFLVLPRMHLGVPSLFALLAVLWLVAAPLVLLVPRHGPAHLHTEPGPPATRRRARASTAALLASFLAFYVATGAFWSFSFLIGEWQGLLPAEIGSVMSLGMVLSIAGGTAVALLGSRFGYLAPLLAALLGNAAFAALLLQPLGTPGFALAVCGVDVLFTFVVALFLSLFGRTDKSGRLLSLANLLICGGLALGPWLLGGFADSGTYTALVAGMLALFLLAPALLLIGRALQRREQARAPAVAPPANLPRLAETASSSQTDQTESSRSARPVSPAA